MRMHAWLALSGSLPLLVFLRFGFLGACNSLQTCIAWFFFHLDIVVFLFFFFATAAWTISSRTCHFFNLRVISSNIV